MIPNNVLNLLSKVNPNIAAFQNMKTPDEVAQYLLNNGKVNQARQMWNNPQIQKMIGNMK